MADNNHLSPQLIMRKKNLVNLPGLNMPPDFILRHYMPGDDAHWENIIEASFKEKYRFGKVMKEDKRYRADRVLFVCHEGKPVATASAFCHRLYPDETGLVHMVGAYPCYKGKRLGYLVSLAVLHKLQAEGKKDVILETDDFRLPAIHVYLELGFEPEYVHENQPQRWEDVFKALVKK